MKCYQCTEKPFRDETDKTFPFCGDICASVWANKHYGLREDGRKNLTISQMQEKLNQMAQEIANQGKPTQKQFNLEEPRKWMNH